MLALLIRDALLIAIAVLIIREIWYPELDQVRVDPLDDPAGGPFDGATDHPFVLAVDRHDPPAATGRLAPGWGRTGRLDRNRGIARATGAGRCGRPGRAGRVGRTAATA